MDSVFDIISDDEIEAVHANANFGSYKQDTHRVYTSERIGWWAIIAENEFDGVIMEGKTPLEAACRAFVFYKLGAVVEVTE